MRLGLLFLLFLLIRAVPLFAEESVAIFNGTDLTNWEAIGKAEWRVEDGVIVGGQDGDPKRSGRLKTKQHFADFQFDVEFLIDEHGKYNSGIYLRDVPDMKGQRYQVNIGRGVAGEYIGLFRDDWLDKGDEKDEHRKPGEWNQLRIRAVGPRIQVWLNGEKIVEYTEPNPKPEDLAAGSITLQTYGAEGHAGWVKFRNLKLVEIRSGQATE